MPFSFFKGDDGRPLVMAHRGNSVAVPENTLEAFEDAARLGVDVIETDVHLTRDGHFVFFHDPRVDRTTDGSGRIKDYTLARLQELDAGYHFQAPDGTFPFRGKGYKIQEVGDILSRFPDMAFNMDIKSRNREAPRLLAELLEEKRATGRVMVGSFWQEQVKRFRKATARISPESPVPTSASILEVATFKRKAYRYLGRNGVPVHPGGVKPPGSGTGRSLAGSLDQESIFGKSLPYQALQVPETVKLGPIRLDVIKNASFVDFCHALDIAVHVWTINDPGDMERLVGWGVDGIFTDDPVTLLAVLDSMGLGRRPLP